MDMVSTRIRGHRQMPVLVEALSKVIDSKEAVAYSCPVVTRPQAEFQRQAGHLLLTRFTCSLSS